MARIDMPVTDAGDIASQSAGADVLFNLGLMYCIGREVKMDMVEAHKWFNLAAIRGSDVAKEYRKEISLEMTSEQICEAQKQARAWLNTH